MEPHINLFGCLSLKTTEENLNKLENSSKIIVFKGSLTRLARTSHPPGPSVSVLVFYATEVSTEGQSSPYNLL